MAVYKCAGRKRQYPDGTAYCDYESRERWRGRCPGCGKLYDVDKVGSDGSPKVRMSAASLGQHETVYHPTGVAEFDQVIGGGLVKGSAILLGGRRGCGKSTLLVTVANGIAKAGRLVLYASAEESADDVGKIIYRLKAHNEHLDVMGNASDVGEVIERAEQLGAFLIIFDSLQTMLCDDVKGSEGSVAQGEAVTNAITGFCKRTKACAIIVNHVNKAGDFAGGEVVQHLVDTIVLMDKNYVYDEDGEIDPDSLHVRSLMSDKNRNGREGMIAYFEMTDDGLKAVAKKKKSRLELV